jgi:hypothetical protein
MFDRSGLIDSLQYVSDARTSILLPGVLFYAFCSRRYSTVKISLFSGFKHLTSELVGNRCLREKQCSGARPQGLTHMFMNAFHVQHCFTAIFVF